MTIKDKSSGNGFEIRRTHGDAFNVEIWGRFPPTWAGHFSSGLSENRISIIRGAARKVNVFWHAEFEVIPARFAPDPKGIDFLELALSDNDTAPQRIIIDEFTLAKPNGENGALLLEVKASDQLGFLGGLLSHLAFCSVFPEEMVIETDNGRISDRFWLRGFGGITPSESAAANLKKKLESFITLRNVA